MRQLCAILLIGIALFGGGRQALANCVTIDQIDKLHALQTRLSSNPDTGLFMTDIRQLRVISGALGDSAALAAVDGNRLAGKGRSVVQFLQNTRTLLLRVSLDDPQSVRPHFTAAVRRNLLAIGDHLNDLRCTDEQIRFDQAQAAENPTAANGDSDSEDMADVAETFGTIAQEIFQWRSLVIAGALCVGATASWRIWTRWRKLRMRRMERHNTHYDTQYRWNDRVSDGPVIDVNCFGAKLRHDEKNPIPPSERLEILIDSIWHDGTVIWSNVHYIGVQFSSAIPLETVALIRAESDLTQQSKTAPRGTPFKSG